MRNKKELKENVKGKINIKKIKNIIIVVLFIIMVVAIFKVAPLITNVIQNCGKFLFECNANDITRVVELILSISIPFTILLVKLNKDEE